VYKPASDFCEVVVFALAGHCQLELTFWQFWLVDSAGCADEHLQVDGRSFCGHQAAGQTGVIKEEIGYCIVKLILYVFKVPIVTNEK
jgi:hypothetical protein